MTLILAPLPGSFSAAALLPLLPRALEPPFLKFGALGVPKRRTFLPKGSLPREGPAVHDGRNGPRNRHEFRAFDL
jgi:hypothetical protein